MLNAPHYSSHMLIFFLAFFFFIYVGCPGQLTRTTIIPHGPLDILQAQEQVRHRGGDRRVHKGSNPEQKRNKSHDWPQQLGPQVRIISFLITWLPTPLQEGRDFLERNDACVGFMSFEWAESKVFEHTYSSEKG
jgi:hypothetical protein